jgi:hypothetical protein
MGRAVLAVSLDPGFQKPIASVSIDGSYIALNSIVYN